MIAEVVLALAKLFRTSPKRTPHKLLLVDGRSNTTNALLVQKKKVISSPIFPPLTRLAWISLLNQHIVARVDVESLSLHSHPVRVSARVHDEVCIVRHRKALNLDRIVVVIAHQDSRIVTAGETTTRLRRDLAHRSRWKVFAHIPQVGSGGAKVGFAEAIVADEPDAVGALFEAGAVRGGGLGLVGVVDDLFVPVFLKGHELGGDFGVRARDGRVGATFGELAGHGDGLEREMEGFAGDVAVFDHFEVGEGAGGGKGSHAEGEEAEGEHVVGIVGDVC